MKIFPTFMRLVCALVGFGGLALPLQAEGFRTVPKDAFPAEPITAIEGSGFRMQVWVTHAATSWEDFAVKAMATNVRDKPQGWETEALTPFVFDLADPDGKPYPRSRNFHSAVFEPGHEDCDARGSTFKPGERIGFASYLTDLSPVVDLGGHTLTVFWMRGVGHLFGEDDRRRLCETVIKLPARLPAKPEEFVVLPAPGDGTPRSAAPEAGYEKPEVTSGNASHVVRSERDARESATTPVPETTVPLAGTDVNSVPPPSALPWLLGGSAVVLAVASCWFLRRKAKGAEGGGKAAWRSFLFPKCEGNANGEMRSDRVDRMNGPMR